MVDILITLRKDGKASVDGISPKGTEWILQNLMHDKPTIYSDLVPALHWALDKEDIIVEIFRDY